MNKPYRVLLMMMISLFLLACATIMNGVSSPDVDNNHPSTKALPTEAPVTTGNVIYKDDFSTENDVVETYQDKDGMTGFSNGVFSIQSFSDLWTWSRISIESTDSYIDVDIEQASGPPDNNAGYGVVCRLNHNDTDGSSGYVFAISGDGYGVIIKIEKNELSALADWKFSSAVNEVNASNHIRASCIGDQLTLEVNGEVIAETTDSSYTSGDAGFAAASFNETFLIVEAHFDNLVISEP